MADIAIEVEGLTKSFGDLVAVKGISLQVPAGRIFGFLGPNGSGKTTTIRMLCGLLRPDSGHGSCLGYDIVTESHAIKRQAGYMTQRFSLYEDLSIRENLEFIARVYGVRKPRVAAAEAIDRLGLGARREQLAGTLSGGWQQRLALGACILPKPRLLLLDEPTAGVDPEARRTFWDHIHHLAADGITVLVSTHYMDEAERCHRLAILDHGAKVADGPPQDLQASTGMNVIEVLADDPYHAQTAISTLPVVASVTQLGIRLRVLIPESVDGALEIVRRTLAEHEIEADTQLSNASLEDVFVAVTLDAPERAA
jgi:ABC-2 type transport system ATP-binding protein